MRSCTGVTAFVIGTKLYVANVGDSRAVLCRGGGKGEQKATNEGQAQCVYVCVFASPP